MLVWSRRPTPSLLLRVFRPTLHPLPSLLQGVFTCFLPDAADGAPAIPHDTFVKLWLQLPSGEKVRPSVRALPAAALPCC